MEQLTEEEESRHVIVNGKEQKSRTGLMGRLRAAPRQAAREELRITATKW